MVLLSDVVKNYRSASLLACKQSLLVSGRAKARVASTQVARSWVARGMVARGPHHVTREPQAKRRAGVLCSEDLHSWWDGGEGVTF